MNKLSRIEEEKQTIEQMIHFYCRDFMFCMQRVTQICTSKTGALSVWRTKEDMSPMYRALLPPQDETKNKRSHAFCRSSNDMVSPHLDSQTFVERAMTTVRL